MRTYWSDGTNGADHCLRRRRYSIYCKHWTNTTKSNLAKVAAVAVASSLYGEMGSRTNIRHGISNGRRREQ